MNTTKNYEKFKLLLFNRNSLNRRHINDIKASIARNGYVGNPILINEKFEILDGQHRFIALKEQGMEIPFEIAENLDYKTIIDLNITQKKWTPADYVNYYASKEHKPSYIRLERLMKEYNLPPSSIYKMARGETCGSEFTRILQNGVLDLTMEDDLKVSKFFEKYTKLLKILKAKNVARLISALAQISSNERFDWKIMFEKAEKYPTLYYPCRTHGEYMKMLASIYNFNTRDMKKRI